ncbi:glycoside hydrolase family 88 protein [Microvirga sp. STR05]|uniref:Glycoside hydrolase family 88 protein n=1 Tax=Hymenobacter duratus TaxID=2771356 RepID=A0ABR8JHV0_9BACT|nr:glycoside hydrolase family 88 protein [Hymenobacter duratus]MBD2716419.1 glycoside hydrolase family 88 protein [Hymenobacter duratus]MBR7951334.1 glycoside hydrolase family 88 protein [Microvirga sp. STR05]
MISRLFVLLFLLVATVSPAQQKPKASAPLARQMADSFMRRYPDSLGLADNKVARWGYEQGLMLKAIERVWQQTGEQKYLDYMVRILDYSIGPDGAIQRYKYEDFNLDNINTGRALLTLSQQSGLAPEKYRLAAQRLHQQLEAQPRTKEGGYWHKKRYPHQIWLDGLYMAEPFAAEYAKVFNQPADFDHVALQFAQVEKHLVDSKTGLLYHGYDESREQRWANKTTGLSPNFWGRGMGWYAMALVDVLDYFPKDHPERAKLVQYLQRLAPVLARYQDPKTGGWWQVSDQAGRAGNYIETSASCMFVYALAKGARLGYLDKKYQKVARKGYEGIVKQFVVQEPTGLLTLNGTVSVGGLGGSPYRDGSYEYYLSEPLQQNDFKGVGPFIMAGVELEMGK